MPFLEIRPPTGKEKRNTGKETPNLPFCISPLLTVGFLVAGTSTTTTELLGLGAPGIGNQECAVVLDESLLQLVLRVLIDVLLVVGDDRLGNGLADGVDLRDVTTAADANADVDTGELVQTDDEERLVDLHDRDVRPYSASSAQFFSPARSKE